MFIVSLAIADLIVGLTVMPISAIYIFTETWVLGVAVCQIWIAVDYTASTASILNLFILSLDRYWSVTSPLRYLRKRTKKRAFVMISIVWCASSLWVIPIVGWHYFAFEGVRSVPRDVCDTEYAKNSVFKVVTAFFNFYLPLSVMYFLYCKIFHEIRKRSEFELGQRNPGGMAGNCLVRLDNSHSQGDSEEREETFSEGTPNQNGGGENSVLMIREDPERISPREGLAGTPRDKQHGRYKNLRLAALKRQRNARTCRHTSSPHFRRVEYVYDENVVDPHTEKLERYYYEHNMSSTSSKIVLTPSKRAHRATLRHVESDLSNFSNSTLSSFDDRRTEALEDSPTSGRAPENYSLLSGIRRIRQAERLLDKTATVGEAGNGASKRGEKEVFVLRDDKNRRLTGMMNIKDRIRNFRQSSSLTKEIKAARQLGVIMGAFTVCFLPYFVLFLVVSFCDDCISPDLMTAATWIGYLNSTLNPFLYPLCNSHFRDKFRKMIPIFSDAPRKSFDLYDRNSLTNVRYD